MTIDPAVSAALVDQNSEDALRLLCAQRVMYSDAKWIRIVRLLGSVIPAAIAPLVVALYPEMKVALAGVAGVWALLSVVVLRRAEKRKAELGASVQEEFDTSVLGLAWNKSLVGQRVPPEAVYSAAKRTHPDKEKVLDWYPDVDLRDPITRALVSQRANLVWDGSLRREYAWLIVCATAILFLLYLSGGLYFSITLEQYVVGLFLPSLSALLHGIEVSVAQFESAAVKDADRAMADQLLDQHKRASSVTMEDCRALQDRIFAGRKAGVLTPNWWYWLRRHDYEEAMAHGAKAAAS